MVTPNSQFYRKNIIRTWLSSLILILFVSAAVYGVLIGASPELMIIGATLGLFIWQLSVQIVYRREDGIFLGLVFPKWTNIRLTIFSVGTGLLLAEVGLQVQLPVLFGVVVFATLLILFSIFRFYRLFIK